MEDPIFEQYTITIKGKEGSYSIVFEPYDHAGKALDEKGRKIYIISSGKEVFYVGEANTSIRTRLKRGCSASNHYHNTKESRSGYRGYKWLATDSILTLNVVIFHDANVKRNIVEAIEAEIVYLIRHHLKQWPTFQNEIHFSNVEGALEKAQFVYNKSIK